MEIIKEVNGTYTLSSKEKCNDGKFHHMVVRGYAKKSDARNDYRNQADKFIQRINLKLNHSVVVSTNSTVKSVCDEYLDNYMLRNKKSTYIKVRRIVNEKIVSYFGADSYSDQVFTEDNVKNWKMQLANSNYSTLYTNQVINIFKSIIDRAIKRDRIETKTGNLLLLTLENIRRDEIVERNVNYWTPNEYLSFINTFDYEDRYKVMFDCFYYCGLRMGELLGLQWKHFDKDNKILHIRQQANNKLGTGKAEITSTKTKNGVRDIDLNIEFYNELCNFRAATYNGNDNEFIFFGEKPFSPTSVRRIFDSHIAAAGVKHIRIHDLRHSHASLLISLGADAFYIMKRLGHASFDETAAIYGHLFPNQNKQILSSLDVITKEENMIEIALE